MVTKVLNIVTNILHLHGSSIVSLLYLLMHTFVNKQNAKVFRMFCDEKQKMLNDKNMTIH